MSSTAAGSAEDKLLAYLPTGLTALLSALAAVGGLTGGIARMFRNNADLATSAFVGVCFAIGCALVGYLLSSVGRQTWARAMAAVGILLFVTSLCLALYTAVATASVKDRPKLSASLVSAEGRWRIEGDAGASGFRATDSLQVYVYGYLERASGESSRLNLLQASAGPDADGTATQEFGVPVPDRPGLVSIVVTASVGDSARYCDGTPVDVTAKFNEVTPEFQDAGNNACLVIRPPTPLRGSPE